MPLLVNPDISLMPWTISVSGAKPILRFTWFQCRMAADLLLYMCFQNGPQRAQGVIGYQQFPFLNQFDTDAPAAIVAFCDAAIHFAQTNVEVHKATRMITDCISSAARLESNVFCRGRGITTLCSHPADMNFNFDDNKPDTVSGRLYKTLKSGFCRICVLQ